jgi:hypothetical protein
MVDVWILTHRRVGDLQQMRTLASALSARVTEKKIVFHYPRLAISMPFLSVRLIDFGQSAPLAPPWPDLVLVAEGALGRLALDIRRRSGGTAKAVCVGRPRGRTDEFDLIITTPQYRVPAGANVVELALPLHVGDEDAMRKEADLLLPELVALPRPWIALLVGGTSAPDILDAATAKTLAREALTLAGEKKGSLLVITSPRTGHEAEHTLAQTLHGSAHVQLWSAVRQHNPYRGYLKLADSFIVTSDSISMIAEAIQTGKPVTVFRLPQRLTGLHRLVNFLYSQRTWPIVKTLFGSGLIEARTDRLLFVDQLKTQGLLDGKHGCGQSQIEIARKRVIQLLHSSTAPQG